MKKFRKFINDHAGIVSVIAVVIILFSMFSIITSLQGCVDYVNSTGQEVTRLSDETAAVLDKASELAPIAKDTLVGVGIAFPAVAGVLGIVGGAISAFFGAYKKYRPQITAEHNKAEVYGNTTKALVYAIEEFKATNSEDWETLKQALMFELKDKVGPEYLAIIDALRDAYTKPGWKHTIENK